MIARRLALSLYTLFWTAALSAQPYVFSQGFDGNGDAIAPRGGSTTGAPVTVDDRVPDAFEAIHAPDLTRRERDARAIRALAGDYRATFEFIEIAALARDIERDTRPYRSWATERIFVITDTPTEIELQHVMVMRFVDDDGNISDPMVMKHWRQRWQWQPDTIWRYAGDRVWRKHGLTDAQADGRWKQTVYQVDDSLRYEALGRWHYDDGVASWRSQRFDRPLPRREASVRDDYDVLSGRHALTHTPHAWLHEQQARKIVQIDGASRALAREIGLVRYRRIAGFDFAPATDYWTETGDFWAAVRHHWDLLMQTHDRLTIRSAIDGMPMFARLFEAADNIESDSTNDMNRRVAELIDPYVDAE